MARDTLIEGSTLTAIADAIREKTETSDVMYPSEMAGKIRAISAGVELPNTIVAGDTTATLVRLSIAVKINSSAEVVGVTIKKAGTYKFNICTNSGGRDGYIYLRKNGENTITYPRVTSGDYTQYESGWHSVELSCSEGDRISVFVKTGNTSGTTTSYPITIYAFEMSLDWDFWEFTNVFVISDKKTGSTTKTSYTASGVYVQIPKTATYTFRYTVERSRTTGTTWGALLYKNGSAISGTDVTWNSLVGSYEGQIACNKGDKIEVYGKTSNTSYTLDFDALTAEEVI